MRNPTGTLDCYLVHVVAGGKPGDFDFRADRALRKTLC